MSPYKRIILRLIAVGLVYRQTVLGFGWCKGSTVLKELQVFVADDSEPIRQQLERALSLIDGCKLVGTASGGDEATERIRALQPDVVILDISMSHREGIRVLREIRKEVPLAEIIIFTADPSVVLF